MVITTPKHQFEIRYTFILSFPTIIQEAVAPFIPMANNVQVERENTLRARYLLTFDNYQIIISWDRLLIIYEGEIKDLLDSNSIMEAPFFNLFAKIKALKYFGNVTNCLCYTIFVQHTEKDEETVLKDFTSRCLNSTNVNKIVSKPSDIAITLVKNTDDRQVTINYGPYFGEADLINRNALPTRPENLEHMAKFGEMAEIKVYDVMKTASFTKYKEYVKTTLEYRDLLWKK